jgi:hypothetical protein
MNAGRDFLLFIFFLVALGAAWFLTGGPGRPISHAGWFLNPTLGGTGGISVPHISLPNASSTDSSGGVSQQQQPQNQPTKMQSLWNYFLNYQPGVGESSAPANSPYAPYVSLQLGNAGSSDPLTEYIVIQTSQNLPQSLTVSGWVLQNVSSNVVVTVGNAAQIPFLGGMNSETPISAGPGSTIIVTTGSSPNGASFRVNECTGYFNQYQTFTPALRYECPQPTEEMLTHPQTLAGDTACRQYVNTLSQCRIVTGVFPQNVSSSCQDFVLNNLSYNGCINAHKNEPNFYRNEWRVFLNRNQELWSNDHGVIRLLDENGKLITQTTY